MGSLQGVDTDDARERLHAEQARVEGLDRGAAGPSSGTAENDDLSELSDYDQHPADTATETFEREKDLSILEQLENELAELQAALERVDAGTYGVDEETGDPIDPARLDAFPTARTNISGSGIPTRDPDAEAIADRRHPALRAGARGRRSRSRRARRRTTLGALLDDLRASYGPDFAAVLDTARVWVNGDEPLAGDLTELARRRRGRRPPTRQRRLPPDAEFVTCVKVAALCPQL